MLIKYKARKGLKLYGDEVFCVAPGSLVSGRNHIRNPDMRYGTDFWVPENANSKVSLVAGQLRVTNVGGRAYVGQVLSAPETGKFVITVVGGAASTGTGVVQVWENINKSTLLATINLPPGGGGVWSVEYATVSSPSVYVEITILNSADAFFVNIKSVKVSEVYRLGGDYVEDLPNAHFDTDTVNWQSTQSGSLVWEAEQARLNILVASPPIMYQDIVRNSSTFYVMRYELAFQNNGASVFVGTALGLADLGYSGTLTQNGLGSFVFRTDGSGRIFPSARTDSSTIGTDVSIWNYLSVKKSSDTLVDGNFRVPGVWEAGSWSFANGSASITGNKGSRLSQVQTNALVQGSSYTYVFGLTVPSGYLRVIILNQVTGIETVSRDYTASGVYALTFVADDTDVKVSFESGVDGATVLSVTNVSGGLSLGTPVGVGAQLVGAASVAGAASNNDTGGLVLRGDSNVRVEAAGDFGIRIPVLSDQNVGVGDWTYVGWGYRGLLSTGARLFLKSNDVTKGRQGEPVILGKISTAGGLTFSVSDDGSLTSDTIDTLGSVPEGFFMWELVCSGSRVHIRVNGVVASSSRQLANASGSLDNTNGFNYIGQYSPPVWEDYAGVDGSAYVRIRYLGDRFIALGGAAGVDDTQLMSSFDGETWVGVKSAVVQPWVDAAYGNGVYVAVAGGGVPSMLSSDGIDWITGNLNALNATSVTFGVGLFIAVSGGEANVYSSADGINWTQHVTPAANDWQTVEYLGSQFIAVARTGTNRVMTSPDGINWTVRSTAALPAVAWKSLAWNGTIYVAVGATASSQCIMTSPTGVTWTIRSTSLVTGLQSVTFGDGKFVAVTNTSLSSVNNSIESIDGVTWSAGLKIALTGSLGWSGIVHAVGRFVVVQSGTVGNMTAVQLAPAGAMSSDNVFMYSNLFRFVPSAIPLSRSRDVYNSEKHLFRPDQKYSVDDASVVLTVDAPTVKDTSTALIGSVFIPDSGEGQETTIRRVEESFSVASRELDYYDAIEYLAFLDAVVRGTEFTYDMHAIHEDSLIDPRQVYLIQQGYSKSRINSLEYFEFAWSMRGRGSK